jgi:hypothetical protein
MFNWKSKFLIKILSKGYSVDFYKNIEIWIKNKKMFHQESETFIKSMEANVRTSLADYLNKSKVIKCIHNGETLIIHVKPRTWHLRHFYRVHKIYKRIT